MIRATKVEVNLQAKQSEKEDVNKAISEMKFTKETLFGCWLLLFHFEYIACRRREE